MDFESQHVNIGDDDDLKILESVAPKDNVNYDSENKKKG